MRRNGGRSTLRRLSVAFAMVASVSLAAPPVGAADAVVGFAWYSDGAFEKSGPAGTSVTVFATSVKPNTPFELVVTPAGNAIPCPRHNLTRLNPTTRTSSASGLIGNTTGALNLAQGQYEICFLERSDLTGFETVTVPVVFTVT